MRNAAKRVRPVTLAVLAAWVLLFSWIGVRRDPDPFWLWVSLAGPAYYMGVSFVLNFVGPRRAAG